MGWRLAFPALVGTGRLWKQGPVSSSVLARVGCCACRPAEASPHTAPGWAHVVCALYIPEVQFANVLTMEPIVLQYVPHDRFNKVSTPFLVPFPASSPGVPPLRFLVLLGDGWIPTPELLSVFCNSVSSLKVAQPSSSL